MPFKTPPEPRDLAHLPLADRKRAPTNLEPDLNFPTLEQPNVSQVINLQRTVGNRETIRRINSVRINASRRQTAGTNRVQRKTVNVAGGAFRDDLIGGGYQAIVNDESDSTGTYNKVGARMELAFIPKNDLNATQVSLVQTTNSTIQNQTHPAVPDQTHSLLGERRTESGSAIDQEIYLSKNSVKSGNQRWDTGRLQPLFHSMVGLGTVQTTNDAIARLDTFFTTGGGANNAQVKSLGINPSSIATNFRKIVQDEGGQLNPVIGDTIPQINDVIALQAKSVNLDPRYSEERRDDQSPLKAPRTPGNEMGSGGWTAVKADGIWESNAALRDEPGHKIPLGDVLNGTETFETAALADGSNFIGSIRWGYTVANSVPTLTPAAIELVNYGTASGELFKAAKKWNNMKVPDLYNEDLKLSTIQLPESDNAKQSPATAFALARWMPESDVNDVLAGLGRATIERHYSTDALGRIRQATPSVARLIELVIKLTEARGPQAVTLLGNASDDYSNDGYSALCAKGVDQIIATIYSG